jgi:hypothetical protein
VLVCPSQHPDAGLSNTAPGCWFDPPNTRSGESAEPIKIVDKIQKDGRQHNAGLALDRYKEDQNEL